MILLLSNNIEFSFTNKKSSLESKSSDMPQQNEKWKKKKRNKKQSDSSRYFPFRRFWQRIHIKSRSKITAPLSQLLAFSESEPFLNLKKHHEKAKIISNTYILIVESWNQLLPIIYTGTNLKSSHSGKKEGKIFSCTHSKLRMISPW